MPTQYTLLGGGQIQASTDLGIVEALRRDAQDWRIEDFLEGMAARAKTQKDVTLRIDTSTSFVADLKQHGFIELESA
jgi:hypothetical protein